MSTAPLKRRENRYADLAGLLKACWAYERFFNRLRRVQGRDDLEDPGVDLVVAQDRLRSIAEDLESADSGHLDTRLDRVETDLLDATGKLSAQDSRIGAADLRRFLTRVRRLDEDLLLGMISFYLYSRRGEAWDNDLVDKVDFLMSRLGEEVSGPLLSRETSRLKAFLASLWDTAAVQEARPPVAQAMRGKVEDIAEQLEGVATLDELEEEEIIGSYRRLKHGLGNLLVQPSVAGAVLETNAALGRAMQRLYGNEEWNLAADFARFAELERSAGLSEALSLELESLRRDMERIEEGRRVDDVRFDAVQEMRRQVRALRPHLVSIEPPQTELFSSEALAPGPAPATAEAEMAWELMGRLFGQLESLLAASGSVEEAEDVLLDPGLPFGLERREVASFLWMRDNTGVDSSVDRLVLTGASLRIRLKTLRDRLEVGVAGGQVEDEAEQALRLAERLQGDFEDEISAAQAAGDATWASEARLLKVLLMRDYSTLWLEMKGSPSGI